MKSQMTLNRSLWRTRQQVSDFAARRNQTLVEYKQGFVYCFDRVSLAEIFSESPDGNDIVAIYNCTDVYFWRKANVVSRSRSKFAA